MQKESFLLGVSLTCLIVMLVGPKVLSVSHDTCESGQDTLKVEVVKPMPNFQLEAHQIHSSLNKSKLKHLLIYTYALCEEYGVDYSLVKAVITTESSWNHKAVSRSDARGLMQIKPQTAFAEFKTPSGDLFDPYVNVTLGVMYLSRLTHKYSMNTLEKVLTAYSHGPTATLTYSSEYVEDNFYVDKVLRNLN
jgi:soluble lytic murein transglycosylase-like protein|tara:strand:- start:146 stop:721 length:576 start_codon:yes stop_codon:yes gene_type:complete